MNPSSPHRPIARRARTATAALSALTAGAVLAVTPVAGAAAPRTTARPTTASTTHRVLSTDVHISGDRSRRHELQVVTAHDRFQLMSQYGRNGRLDFQTWQKDALGGRERAVERVVIKPDERTWASHTGGVAPLPGASFGIQSTAAEVAQAIRDGDAHRDGLGMKDGRRVRLLTLKVGHDERSALLWVDPVTLAPVASATAYDAHGGSVRVVSAHWENASAGILHRLETAPKVPAGFRVSHS